MLLIGIRPYYVIAENLHLISSRGIQAIKGKRVS